MTASGDGASRQRQKVTFYRGVVTGAMEPSLAPDADPLAPEDSKSNSKQLKLKL